MIGLLTNPFIAVEQQDVFHIAQSDGASSFLIRILPYSQVLPIEIRSGLGGHVTIAFPEETPVAPWIKNLLFGAALEAFPRKEAVTMFLSHNVASTSLREALKRLIDGGIAENAEDINFLSYMNALGQGVMTADIQDIVSMDGKNLYLHNTINERLALVKNEFVNSSESLVYNTPDGSLFIQNPITAEASKHMLPMVLDDMLAERDGLYYRVDIYGNECYSVYHPKLQSIQEKTGVKLHSPIVQKEYFVLRNTLRNL